MKCGLSPASGILSLRGLPQIARSFWKKLSTSTPKREKPSVFQYSSISHVELADSNLLSRQARHPAQIGSMLLVSSTEDYLAILRFQALNRFHMIFLLQKHISALPICPPESIRCRCNCWMPPRLSLRAPPRQPSSQRTKYL